MDKAEDRILNHGDPICEKVGFTPNNFNGYLWIKGNCIYIPFIVSLDPYTGNFSKLVKSILDHGYICAVPTPLGRMREIVEHLGFYQIFRYEEAVGENVEYWIKKDNNMTVEHDLEQQKEMIAQLNKEQIDKAGKEFDRVFSQCLDDSKRFALFTLSRDKIDGKNYISVYLQSDLADEDLIPSLMEVRRYIDEFIECAKKQMS